MRKSLVVTLTAILCCLGTSLATSPAFADDSSPGQLVSDVAASHTPDVLDGRVYSVTQVGNTMLLGGTFTTAANEGSTDTLARTSVLAFDATTGLISTTFIPNPNGEVREILPTGDGTSVYIAGQFTSIGGVARTNIARVRVSDGAVLPTFNAGAINGEIKDIALSGGRLWMGGAFTHVQGHPQPALATIDPTTGAFLPYMGLTIAGVNNGGVTEVMKMDITPDGSRLVAIGNFDTLNGVKNHQILMLDLTGASAAPSTFNTTFYTSTCSSSFESYMRDIDISPDGTYFVVATTGAYGGSTSACDETSRWEINDGPNAQPSWTNYTGGDTTYSVEVTQNVVYTGGHMRWQNNAFAGDKAGEGAISRPGLAALDPQNGMPYTWNPTRDLGVGVFDFLNTDQGLWVASDTDRIGNSQYRARIALLPSAGLAFPAYKTPTLPDDVYIGSSTGGTLARRHYSNNGTVSAATAVPTGSINWNNVRGSFMLNGWLYTAMSDGTFVRQTFDGTTYGAPVAVNLSDQLVKLTDWATDIKSMTGLFYDSGRMYFTLSGSSSLYYRYLNAQSDAVGAKRLVASGNVAGIDFSQVHGMFATNSNLYWATSDNRLHAINWSQGPLSGAPVAGTASVVSGPGVDSATWNAKSMFLFQDGTGQSVGDAPTAAFSPTCTSLDCTFDGSGSTAVGGSITSYAWTFGDGGTGTGVSPAHSYAASGNYPVTLTVTTNSGATATVSQNLNVVRINKPPTAAYTWTCAGLQCSFDGSSSTDTDGTVTGWSWDFGDGGTATGAATTHTFAAGGDQQVTLTATDNDGGTATSTQTVTPTSQSVQYVGSAESNANTKTPTVTIPSSVQAGDTMVMTLAVNASGLAMATPTGWTSLDVENGSNVEGQSWTRTATAADGGSSVSTGLSAIAKADLSVSAYRASGGGQTTVTAHQGGLDQTTATAHTAPGVTVAGAGSWVATYFAAKASTAIGWSVPGVQLRTSNPGSGSGLMSAASVDSGGSVPSGPTAGLTGTTSGAVTRVVMFTTVIGLQ